MFLSADAASGTRGPHCGKQEVADAARVAMGG
jgi:hypothetical protein